MSLSIVLNKVDETPHTLLYAFGVPDTTVGRVRLHKASGDVEIVELDDSGTPARPPFFLAQIIPRLQDFHARGTYPSHDRWSA